MTTKIVLPTRTNSGGVSSTGLTSPLATTISRQQQQQPPPSSKPMSAAKANFLARLRNPPRPQVQVDKEQLKKQLTPLQYKVTQEKFTERAFSGEYLKLNADGVYCCVVCGEELFASQCKFDSGCGWPAFSSVVDNAKVLLQADLSHVGGNLLLLAFNQDLARTEVTCAKCGSHLGHVFDDGPKPTGKRYCVNSASLKFKQENNEEIDNKVVDKKVETPAQPKSCDKVTKQAFVVEAKEIKPSVEKVPPPVTRRSRFASKSVERPRNPPPPPPPSTLSTTILKPIKVSNGLNLTNKTPINPSTTTMKIKDTKVDRLDTNNNAVLVTTNIDHVATPKKYKSVQSRYLNHLQAANKQNVIKIYTFPKQAAGSTCLPSDDKKLLETDL